MDNEDWPPISRGRLMGLQKWYTEGLFLTYGPEHHRQRDELWKPLFQDPRHPRARRVPRRAPGRLLDRGQPDRAVHRAALAVLGDRLGGAHRRRTSTQRPDLLEALELGVAALAWLVLPFGPARWNWPLPQSRRTREARAQLDSLITTMIAERRVRRRRRATCSRSWSARRRGRRHQRRDRPRDVQDVVRRRPAPRAVHLDAAPAGASTPTSRHAGTPSSTRCSASAPRPPRTSRALAYTVRVIKESMRVFPPVWGFFRQMTGRLPARRRGRSRRAT